MVGIFVPTARQLSTTVMYDFSAPVVFTLMVFWPLKSTALLGGRSNEMGGLIVHVPDGCKGVLMAFSLFKDKAVEVVQLLLHISW